jgi:hypothetical protein
MERWESIKSRIAALRYGTLQADGRLRVIGQAQ